MSTNKEREWIDADDLRKWMDNFIQEGRTGTPHEWLADAFTSLQNTFLTPQPRTLEDMTPEEREACRWMQARDDVGNRVVITKMNEVGQEATVLYESGEHYEWPYSIIVPLPDLRGMVWPEDTPKESSTLPSPEDVPEGELWRVEFDGKLDVAVRELPGARNPWWLMRGWRATDAEITLLYRLVPEVKA